MTFDELGDRLEKLCANPLALPVFTGAFIVGMLTIGVDVTNIAVSYLTAALLFLGMGRARRDRKAAQAKLDDLEAKIPEASTENVGLEERSEEEIDARRGIGPEGEGEMPSPGSQARARGAGGRSGVSG